MLTDEQLEAALKLIDSRYQKITEKYLRKVGGTINKIGELNQSSVNGLIQLRRMGVDVRTINRELRKVTGLTKKDLKKLYKKAAQEANTDARFSYVTKGVEPDNVRWDALVEDIWRQTAGTMDNLANSTVVADGYKAAVDEAIQAVTMGVTDYNVAIRDTIRQIGTAGMKVQYESGARKRLDSAVRMNVLDGVRQVQQKAQELIGEETGADGVEITAHPHSAPDHEPVQGKQFDLENFQKMQAGQRFEDTEGRSYKPFSRPITQWHCRHLVYYIILGVTKPMYAEEQLQQWEEDNQRGCVIDGKHYTTYQATQLMRKLELKIRQQKDTAILAKASGDTELRRECQGKISTLTKKYKEVAEKAGLKTRFDKTRVEGYKEIKKSSKPGEGGTVGKTVERYSDITQEWRDNAMPNSHAVEDAQEVTVSGNTYKVDGHNVVLDYSHHEKEIAELLEKEFGGEMKMLPRVNNPQGVSTPDYLFRGEGFDLKTIGETTGKNPLLNRIKKAKAQSDNFVFDITDSGLADSKVLEQITKAFSDKETEFVDKIVIVRNGRVVNVFKRA